MQKSTKLLLGATVAVGVGVALFVLVLDRLTNDSREAALLIYESMQNSLGESVAAGQDRLRSVIDDPRALSGENCHLPLSEELEKYKEHHDVFLRIKPDGMLDCTPAGPVDKDVDLSGRLYFKKAIESGGPVIGEFLVGKVSNEPVLAVSNVAKNDDGSVRYVFVTGLKLTWLKSVIEMASRDHGLVVELHDAAGVPLSYFEDSSAKRTFGQSSRVELIRLPILPDQIDVEVVILEQL